jgi:hypothetical protein
VATRAAFAAITFIVIIASREDAAKVLLEADSGFFRYAGGVGIDSLEKILDFLLNLPADDTYVRIARGYFPWLDLVLHFRLHPLPSPKWRPVLSL